MAAAAAPPLLLATPLTVDTPSAATYQTQLSVHSESNTNLFLFAPASAGSDRLYPAPAAAANIRTLNNTCRLSLISCITLLPVAVAAVLSAACRS